MIRTERRSSESAGQNGKEKPLNDSNGIERPRKSEMLVKNELARNPESRKDGEKGNRGTGLRTWFLVNERNEILKRWGKKLGDGETGAVVQPLGASVSEI